MHLNKVLNLLAWITPAAGKMVLARSTGRYTFMKKRRE